MMDDGAILHPFELEAPVEVQDWLYKLACAADLDAFLSALSGFIEFYWGFNYLGIQILNPERNCLEFLNCFSSLPLSDETREAVSRDVPLRGRASISALIAIKKKTLYTHIDSLSDNDDELPEIDRLAVIALDAHDNLLIPIIGANGNTLGVLHLISRNRSLHLKKSESDSIRQFINGLAEKIRTYLDKIELERFQARQLKQAELAHRINTTIDLPELLDLLASEILASNFFDGFMICLIDDRRMSLVCENLHLPPELEGVKETYLKHKYPLEAALSDLCKAPFSNYLSFDEFSLHELPESLRLRMERWRMKKIKIVPLRSRSQLIGAVILFNQNLPIPDKAVELISIEASVFLDQILNAMFYSRLKAREEIIETAENRNEQFLQLINSINHITDVDSIISTICEELIKVFTMDRATLFMLDTESNRVNLKHSSYRLSKDADRIKKHDDLYREFPMPLEMASGAAPTCILQNRQIVFPDCQQILNLPMSDLDREALRILNDQRVYIGTPIRHEGRAIGALFLASFGDNQPTFSEGQLRIIDLLGTFVGRALENATLYQTVDQQKRKIEYLNDDLKRMVKELRELARKDQLTGLYNFGFFLEALHRRINEYRRCKGLHSMAIAILDLDYFKQFNEHYGHVAGNTVLKEVAHHIVDSCRQMDIVCRYGGEEFVVILPKCDLEGVQLLSRRICERIAATSINIGNQEINITISIGCAEYTPDEKAIELIDRADKALNLAKENGRNRVET